MALPAFNETRTTKSCGVPMMEFLEWFLIALLISISFMTGQVLRLKGEAEGIERLVGLAKLHQDLLEFVGDMLEEIKKKFE